MSIGPITPPTDNDQEIVWGTHAAKRRHRDTSSSVEDASSDEVVGEPPNDPFGDFVILPKDEPEEMISDCRDPSVMPVAPSLDGLLRLLSDPNKTEDDPTQSDDTFNYLFEETVLPASLNVDDEKEKDEETISLATLQKQYEERMWNDEVGLTCKFT